MEGVFEESVSSWSSINGACHGKPFHSGKAKTASFIAMCQTLNKKLSWKDHLKQHSDSGRYKQTRTTKAKTVSKSRERRFIEEFRSLVNVFKRNGGAPPSD